MCQGKLVYGNLVFQKIWDKAGGGESLETREVCPREGSLPDSQGKSSKTGNPLSRTKESSGDHSEPRPSGRVAETLGRRGWEGLQPPARHPQATPPTSRVLCIMAGLAPRMPRRALTLGEWDARPVVPSIPSPLKAYLTSPESQADGAHSHARSTTATPGMLRMGHAGIPQPLI